jgi:signal transduction histidine kinase
VTESVKLLLVDDEERNLDALETILESTGCTLVRANSANAALLALLHNEFAAIILDIKMPGISGFELAQLIKVRRRTQHVPILFLTAYALDEKDVLQAYDVGAVDYITKPINPAILRSKVAVFIDLFRTTQALSNAVEALNLEISQREKVQEELRVSKDELEMRVLERTAALDRANREVQDHADALTEANRRKDEFLATLAHELRNPITPIRYAVEVVKQKNSSTPDLHWALELIERQTQHMARLIDDLLDVNRITRNALELRIERVGLSRVINAAIETSRPLIERSGYELVVRMPAQDVSIDADVVRLAQVFSNLLNNAAKYGKGSGGSDRIYFSAEIVGDTAIVKVADEGVGIDRAMLPLVFEMFTQVGRSLEQSAGGLGIGLALAKRLVEMHGGKIKAFSEGVGKGSQFVVSLPITTKVAVPAESPQRRPQPEKILKHRILIADDNVDVAEAFEIMLQTLGHEIAVAHDGVEAIEKAAMFQPDVIVLDVGMPKLNGYDAAREIRRQDWGQQVVLIAITGWGSEKDKQRAEEAGFDLHLVKPVEPTAISDLLASWHTAGGGIDGIDGSQARGIRKPQI